MANIIKLECLKDKRLIENYPYMLYDILHYNLKQYDDIKILFEIHHPKSIENNTIEHSNAYTIIELVNIFITNPFFLTNLKLVSILTLMIHAKEIMQLNVMAFNALKIINMEKSILQEFDNNYYQNNPKEEKFKFRPASKDEHFERNAQTIKHMFNKYMTKKTSFVFFSLYPRELYEEDILSNLK